mgnify:CR=1 FL=1
MDTKKLLIATVLCLGLCVAFCLMVDQAHAAGAGDKNLASKTGTQLGTKEFDKDRLPGKGKMAMGFGSIFVMIAVMKYL